VHPCTYAFTRLCRLSRLWHANSQRLESERPQAPGFSTRVLRARSRRTASAQLSEDKNRQWNSGVGRKVDAFPNVRMNRTIGHPW